MPEQFSLMKTNIFNDVSISKGEKFGVEIDKGFLLNEDYLVEHEKEIQKLLQFYSAYPDLFIDRITKSGDNFKLFFYQRIFLRAVMRFNEVYVVAPRAWSKSFITILGIMLQCIFTPGSKRFICAPFIRQAARIAKEKIIEIFDHFPILKKEIVGWELSDIPGNYGPDYTTLKFRSGSIFDVVGATDSTRGGRRTSGLIDEVRDADETEISEIVIPLINVARRLPDNTVNPNEQFNQQIVFATSAGLKNSFAYNKLIDLFENSIINPKETFVFGNDYRIPMMHGLLSKNFVDKLKMSPSFNIESFQREYRLCTL